MKTPDHIKISVEKKLKDLKDGDTVCVFFSEKHYRSHDYKVEIPYSSEIILRKVTE